MLRKRTWPVSMTTVDALVFCTVGALIGATASTLKTQYDLAVLHAATTKLISENGILRAQLKVKTITAKQWESLVVATTRECDKRLTSQK